MSARLDSRSVFTRPTRQMASPSNCDIPLSHEMDCRGSASAAADSSPTVLVVLDE